MQRAQSFCEMFPRARLCCLWLKGLLRGTPTLFESEGFRHFFSAYSAPSAANDFDLCPHPSAPLHKSASTKASPSPFEDGSTIFAKAANFFSRNFATAPGLSRALSLRTP